MCCDPFLETKKGIAAANPSYVQEELFSSFLCIYNTAYAAAPQIFAEQKKAASNLAAFVYYKLKSSPVFPVSVSSFPASGIPNAAAITSPRLTFPFGFTGFFASSFTSYFMLAGFAKSLLLLLLRCCLADT